MEDFKKWLDWAVGILYFLLIGSYALLTAINYRKRGELETEYRAACAECGGEYENSRDDLYCDSCGGPGDGS